MTGCDVKNFHYMLFDRQQGWIIEYYESERNSNSIDMTPIIRLSLDRHGKDNLEVFGENIREKSVLEIQNRLAYHIWHWAKTNGFWFTLLVNESNLSHYDFFKASLSVELPEKLLCKLNHAKDHSDIAQIIAGRLSYRSVHKAIYESMSHQLETRGWYHPVADIIICRAFEDPNLVARLLNLSIKTAMFEHLHDIEHAIYFLKLIQSRHRPSTIVSSIEKSIDYVGRFYLPRWVEIIRMADELLHNHPSILKNRMRKTRMVAKDVQDEMIRCQQYLHL